MKENYMPAPQYKEGRYKIDQAFIEKCDREFDDLLESAVKKLCHNSEGIRVMGLTGPTCSGKTTTA
jgi:type II secretory ATPase GspE/PulE/Tfp pilus assembly ATPase PilB-like protein